MEDTQLEQVEQENPTTEDVGEVEQESTEDKVAPEEKVVIPANYEPELRSYLESIDQVGQKAFIDKVTNLEKGYQKKFQDLSTERAKYDADKQAFEANKSLFDTYQGFDRSIDPSMRAEILAHYGNVPAYMSALHQMDLMASRDPTKFLINYCNNNGITRENLEELLSGRAYQEHQQTISQEELKAQIMKEFEEKQQQQRYVEEVTRFAQAKNENGEDLHPLLSDNSFVQDMEALQKAYPNRSLEELYKMAEALRPDLRQQAIEAEAKKIAEAKDVAKAKVAVGVKPQTPIHNMKPANDWRSVLSDSLDGLDD